MWSVELVFVLARCVQGAVYTSEACHVLGARFAHIVSTCEFGWCVNLGRDVHGAFGPLEAGLPRVSCEAAVRHVDEFLHEQRYEEPLEVTEDPAEQLLEFIQTRLLVDLELISLGLDTSRDGFIQSMGALDAWMLRVAAQDWTQWTSRVLARVVTSEEWKALHELFANILRLSITGTWLQAGRRDALSSAIRFYFDFVSLMGRHLVSPGAVWQMHIAIAHREPIHRLSDSRDREVPWSSGVPSSVNGLVRLSLYIEELASGALNHTEWLRLVLKGWRDDRSASAAQAMIGDAFRIRLPTRCPRFVMRLYFLAGTLARIDRRLVRALHPRMRARMTLRDLQTDA